jgi:putative selenium metabolism hydrolase
MNMNNEITSLAETLKEDLAGFLRDIIAIPSVCGNEEAVIQRIRQEMDTIGYEKVWTDPMGNLFGQIGSGDRIIVFDGHCDTVDIGNQDNWQVDPFMGDSRNGIIYGRGAADQKGGLAAAVYAGKILKSLNLQENFTFIVVASVLEEDFEGLSWKYIIEEDNITPEAVILTEPSDMSIKIGQRGRMEMKLKTEGVSCHGSTPELGENAVYTMAPVIQDVERLNRDLVGNTILGKGSVVVTDVRSTAPSLCAVPDSATIHMDRRLTAGEGLETSLQEINSLGSLKGARVTLSVPEYTAKSYTGYTSHVKAYVPMWLMEESHPLVRTAQEAYKSQFNSKTDIGVWKFSTNGVATKGIFDIPTIGFGPGKEEHAHSPDDQVKIEDLVNAASFYAAFVNAWI